MATSTGILKQGSPGYAEMSRAPHGPPEVTVMSSRKPGMRGAPLARCARWLGCDRNPLRRASDWAEVATRLAFLILLVVTIPVAGISAGQWTDHMALHHARAQAAADHPVRAILLQQSPSVGSPDAYSAVEVNWVQARWKAPDGSGRTGVVLAPAGAQKGSTVPAWVDASGTIADPPASHSQVVGVVFIAVTLTCLTWLSVLIAAQALIRRALGRRRLSAWDAEWRAIGPLWTGHRT
jgi:hypothetical protein